MLSIAIKIDFPIDTARSGAVARVMRRFSEEGGKLVVAKVREVLGTEGLYKLDPAYAARKPRLKGFRRYAGKAADQPLIFSGEMYEALTFSRSGDEIRVSVDSGKGINPRDGRDYAELWEQEVDYLGQGLALAEDELADLLTDIIVEELVL